MNPWSSASCASRPPPWIAASATVSTSSREPADGEREERERVSGRISCRQRRELREPLAGAEHHRACSPTSMQAVASSPKAGSNAKPSRRKYAVLRATSATGRVTKSARPACAELRHGSRAVSVGISGCRVDRRGDRNSSVAAEDRHRHPIARTQRDRHLPADARAGNQVEANRWAVIAASSVPSTVANPEPTQIGVPLRTA